MKFLADLPLMGLAKWLRLCGFDTDCRRLALRGPDSLPPPAPETFILTRQEALKRLARPDLLVIEADSPEAQLKEVLSYLRITASQLQPLSRCSRCNDRLTPIPRERAQGRVPEYVFHYHDRFFECPRCRRLFWPGSHLPAILKTLEAPLKE